VISAATLALASPATAENISLYCVANSGPLVGAGVIVNLDYATSRVMWGNVKDEGTTFGPDAAEITDRVIAWGGSSNGSAFHYSINRVAGTMVFDQWNPPHVHINQTFTCSARPPAAKPKF
jgi:hypothetical protein